MIQQLSGLPRVLAGDERHGAEHLERAGERRRLSQENARLKRLVADLTLDRHILQEVLRKKV